METDGLPAEADRQIRRLESVEVQALSLGHVSEGEETSERRDERESEARELEPKVKAIRAQLDARRGVVASLRALGKELAEARAAAEQAREKKDLAPRRASSSMQRPRSHRCAWRAPEATARKAGVGKQPRVLGEEDVARRSRCGPACPSPRCWRPRRVSC